MTTLPYDGTKIAADGRRYPYAVHATQPTAPPTAPGKFVTHAEYDPVGSGREALTRVVTDGVTVDGDATFESATALFTSNDVGAAVVGAGIPEGAVIASVTDADTVELSIPANASDTDVEVTIVRDLAKLLDNPEVLDQLVADMTRSVADGVTTDTDETVTSATAAFVAADLGAKVTGDGIPAGATIASVTSGTEVELSVAATATDTGVALTIVRDVVSYIDAGDA